VGERSLAILEGVESRTGEKEKLYHLSLFTEEKKREGRLNILLFFCFIYRLKGAEGERKNSSLKLKLNHPKGRKGE